MGTAYLNNNHPTAYYRSSHINATSRRILHQCYTFKIKVNFFKDRIDFCDRLSKVPESDSSHNMFFKVKIALNRVLIENNYRFLSNEIPTCSTRLE
jgi:hypothetical protein